MKVGDYVTHKYPPYKGLAGEVISNYNNGWVLVIWDIKGMLRYVSSHAKVLTVLT